MVTDWLASGFLGSLDRGAERPALSIGGEDWSYGDLAARAAGIASALGPARTLGDAPPLTALLAARSVAAHAGLLAILLDGHGYVPLNPQFPAARLAWVLAHSGCRRLIVDREGEAVLTPLLDATSEPLIVVLADRDTVAELAARHPRHDIRPGLGTGGALTPAAAPPGDAMAYLLYTSGSTGRPKGVMVSHSNVAHFLDVAAERYALSAEDRFSQMFDLGFDLSVLGIFGAWKVGGCLCCPDQGDMMLPADYINRERLSIWFSVPSTAILMNRLRQLEPGAFAGLRLSLFCGEALNATTAAAWAAAAPGAVLENLYGPTEVTLACTAYRWTGPEDAGPATVPIGHPLPGLGAKVVDGNLAEVAPGAEGELLMTGPQVTLGYWRDAGKTAEVFVTDPETGARAYRTGDLARRPSDDDGPLTYLGRIDHQVKLHGHRIELGEIEAVLRELSGAPQAVVLGWPVTADGIAGLAGFVESHDADTAALLEAARARLPGYMIPKTLRAVAEFPLTSNGKIDRAALTALLTKTPGTDGTT